MSLRKLGSDCGCTSAAGFNRFEISPLTFDPTNEIHPQMAQALPVPKKSEAGEIEHDFAVVSEMLASRSQRVGEALDQTLARRDEGFDGYRQNITKIVEDMAGLIAAGHSIDVDDLIDRFADDERDYVKARESISRQMTALLRSNRPLGQDDVVILNRANFELAKRLNALARLCRDARWKLMGARAEFQPSEGVGPVRGKGEPVD